MKNWEKLYVFFCTTLIKAINLTEQSLKSYKLNRTGTPNLWGPIPPTNSQGASKKKNKN